jgi:hypothetical protein
MAEITRDTIIEAARRAAAEAGATLAAGGNNSFIRHIDEAGV